MTHKNKIYFFQLSIFLDLLGGLLLLMALLHLHTSPSYRKPVGVDPDPYPDWIPIRIQEGKNGTQKLEKS
jgi:hypothetical protein